MARDRTRRTITKPKRYGQTDLIYYALNVAEEIQGDESNCFKEAMESKEKEKWLEAMTEEMQSLEKNKT